MKNIALRAFQPNALSGKEKVVMKTRAPSLFHPLDAKVEVGLVVSPLGEMLS